MADSASAYIFRKWIQSYAYGRSGNQDTPTPRNIKFEVWRNGKMIDGYYKLRDLKRDYPDAQPGPPVPTDRREDTYPQDYKNKRPSRQTEEATMDATKIASLIERLRAPVDEATCQGGEGKLKDGTPVRWTSKGGLRLAFDKSGEKLVRAPGALTKAISGPSKLSKEQATKLKGDGPKTDADDQDDDAGGFEPITKSKDAITKQRHKKAAASSQATPKGEAVAGLRWVDAAGGIKLMRDDSVIGLVYIWGAGYSTNTGAERISYGPGYQGGFRQESQAKKALLKMLKITDKVKTVKNESGGANAKAPWQNQGRSVNSHFQYELIAKPVLEQLKSQWRNPNHRSNQAPVHLFNEQTGQEYFLTAWDGHQTVTAWAPGSTGMRAISLHEIYEGGVSSLQVDAQWDSRASLSEVQNAYPVRQAPASFDGNRIRSTSLDESVSRVKNLKTSGLTRTPLSHGPTNLPQATKFRQEAPSKTQTYLICTEESYTGEVKTAAYLSGAPRPFAMTPIESVQAVSPEAALAIGKQLMESSSHAERAHIPTRIQNASLSRCQLKLVNLDESLSQAHARASKKADQAVQESVEVATEIMRQLKAGMPMIEYLAMGIKDTMSIEDGVQFKTRSAHKGAIRIVLNGNDYYDIEFLKGSGINYKSVKTLEDIDAENLGSVIRDHVNGESLRR